MGIPLGSAAYCTHSVEPGNPADRLNIKSKSSIFLIPSIMGISSIEVPFISNVYIARKSEAMPLTTASIPGLKPKLT